MALLQFLNRPAYLYHLIRPCHLSLPLKVYSWIAWPGCFENMVTADNPRLSEVLTA